MPGLTFIKILGNLKFFSHESPTPENKDHLAESATRLAGTPGAVELRNRHWYGGPDGAGEATRWTLDMLRDLGLSYVMVDGPQGLESSVPPVSSSIEKYSRPACRPLS